MNRETLSRLLVTRRRLVVGALVGGSALLAACGAPPTKGPPTSAPAGTTAQPSASTGAGPTAGAASAAASAAAPTATATEVVAPASPPTALPTATPVISNIGAGQKVIDFWNPFGGPDLVTVTEMLQQFVKANPAYQVHQEALSQAILYQKLPAAIIAGSPPDLAIIHIWALAQFSTRGLLRDASDLYKGNGFATGDFLPQVMNQLSYKGKLQGVPFNAFTWLCYANADVWKDAGLDATQRDATNPFKDGAEFIQVSQQLTRDKSGRHPTDSGFDGNNVAVWAIDIGATFQTFLSTIWQFGGSIVSDDGKKATVNSDQVAAAIQYWYDAIHKYKIAPIPVGFDSSTAFVNGNLAMWMQGSWQKNLFTDHPQLQPAIKPWFTPTWGKQPTTFASAHIMVIPSAIKGASLDAASKLTEWIANNSLIQTRGGMLPPRLSLLEKPEVINDWEVKVVASEFEEIGRIEKQDPNVTQIQNTFLPEFIAVLTNQRPLKDALAEAENRIQAILDREEN